MRKRKKKPTGEMTKEELDYFDSSEDETKEVDDETLSAAIALEVRTPVRFTNATCLSTCAP